MYSGTRVTVECSSLIDLHYIQLHIPVLSRIVLPCIDNFTNSIFGNSFVDEAVIQMKLVSKIVAYPMLYI